MLSEAKKQAPVDSIQKSELTSYIEIKLLSNCVIHIHAKYKKVKKRKGNTKRVCVSPHRTRVCATYTSEIKASKQKRGKEKRGICVNLVASPMQPSYGLVLC